MIINRVSSWDSNLYFIFIFEAGKVSGSIIQYLQNNLLVRHIQVNFELGDPLQCTNADLISERQMDPFSAQLIRFLVLSWDIPEFEFLTSPSIPNHLRELISFLPQRSWYSHRESLHALRAGCMHVKLTLTSAYPKLGLSLNNLFCMYMTIELS